VGTQTDQLGWTMKRDDIYRMWDLLAKLKEGEELTKDEMQFVITKLLEKFHDDTLD
jgi:hypothetical protein